MRKTDEIAFSEMSLGSNMTRILEERWIASKVCMENGAYLPAIVMMGSLVEGMLYAVIAKNKEKALRIRGLRTHKEKQSGIPYPIEKWSFYELAQVAHQAQWMKSGVNDFVDPLRDWRNLVHPREQENKNVFPYKGICSVCLEITKLVISDLSTELKRGSIPEFVIDNEHCLVGGPEELGIAIEEVIFNFDKGVNPPFSITGAIEYDLSEEFEKLQGVDDSNLPGRRRKLEIQTTLEQEKQSISKIEMAFNLLLSNKIEINPAYWEKCTRGIVKQEFLRKKRIGDETKPVQFWCLLPRATTCSIKCELSTLEWDMVNKNVKSAPDEEWEKPLYAGPGLPLKYLPEQILYEVALPAITLRLVDFEDNNKDKDIPDRIYSQYSWFYSLNA
jgi:hypothetical protein